MALFDGTTDGMAMAALAAGAAGIGALFLSARSGEDEEIESPEERSGTNGSERLALEYFDRRRIKRYRRAAKAYTGWSADNVAVSAVGIAKTTGNWCHFFEMNAMWSAVGLLFGPAVDYVMSRREPDGYDRVSVIDDAEGTERLVLADGGFSLSTAVLGAYLWSRGIRSGSERLQGYGTALIFQGTAAAIFDGTLYELSRRHREQFEEKLAASAPRLENRAEARG